MYIIILMHNIICIWREWNDVTINIFYKTLIDNHVCILQWHVSDISGGEYRSDICTRHERWHRSRSTDWLPRAQESNIVQHKCTKTTQTITIIADTDANEDLAVSCISPSPVHKDAFDMQTNDRCQGTPLVCVDSIEWRLSNLGVSLLAAAWISWWYNVRRLDIGTGISSTTHYDIRP